MNVLKIFAVAVMSAALVAPPVASAQTPATTGYDETGVLPKLPPKKDVIPPPQGEVLGENKDGGTQGGVPGGEPPSVAAQPNPRAATPPVTERRETGSTPPVKAGTLPFTGLDVGIVALLGMLLVGTGFALRRSRGAHTS